MPINYKNILRSLSISLDCVIPWRAGLPQVQAQPCQPGRSRECRRRCRRRRPRLYAARKRASISRSRRHRPPGRCIWPLRCRPEAISCRCGRSGRDLFYRLGVSRNSELRRRGRLAGAWLFSKESAGPGQRAAPGSHVKLPLAFSEKQ